MDEDAGIIFMLLFWAVLAYTVYLRFWVVRRLRKKVYKLVDLTAAPPPPVATLPPAPTPQEESELRRIKERLHVLERIAVDKENTLSREINELRAAGG